MGPGAWIKLWAGGFFWTEKRLTERGHMWLFTGVAVVFLLLAAIRWWSTRRQRFSGTPMQKERRRSYRVALATPVFVYGWLADEPFSESTETLNVSAVGGLILLSAKVIRSQELILTNLQTNEDVPCRVARSIPEGDNKTLTGLDFLQDSQKFWQIDFVSRSPHSFSRDYLTYNLVPLLRQNRITTERAQHILSTFFVS